MVETALFPRPAFATFLRSDDGVDPLSYYNYQRLQRLQKVARLQERRSKSYEPGYKKTTAVQTSPPQQAGSDRNKSRQIFVKPSLKHDAQGVPPGGGSAEMQVRKELGSAVVASKTGRFPAEGPKRLVSVSLVAGAKPERGDAGVGGGRKEEGETELRQFQTESQPPAVRRFSRPAKSATVQGMQQRSVSSKTSLLPRPKTAGVVTRDVGTLTTTSQHHTGAARKTDEDCTKLVDLDAGEEENAFANVEKMKENMARSYRWTSATKRAYNEVDWSERATPVPPPPLSTVEQFPDPVSQKLTFRRYHSCPEPWQMYGPEWDFVQSRCGDYSPLEPVNFHAPTSYNQCIPGYTGYVVGSGDGEIDHPLLSRLLVRRITPHPTRISRKANIPGYAGHTHWARREPAHSDLPHPNPLTTARTHREIPLEEDPSPFQRSSPLSKTITLVSPYNPFNKIEF